MLPFKYSNLSRSTYILPLIITLNLDCFCLSVCNGLFLSVIFFSPQISVRLLAHKIQSPQEWEAIQALTVCCVICSISFFDILQLKLNN